VHDSVDFGADRENHIVAARDGLGENSVDGIARLGTVRRNRGAETNPKRLPGCKVITAERQHRAKDR